MVFSEKSVVGLILGLSVAANLTAGFVPNKASRASSNLGSFADDDWFYEEKKTMYSEESTEKGKRIYSMNPGTPTQVFHDNYPHRNKKSPVQPSPYLPAAITSDQRWYQQESTLSYDATMRQRIGQSTAKTSMSKRTVALESDDQGMRAPMPAVEPTNSTATSESPHQPAVYSAKNTKTAAATFPVANTVEPKAATPLGKPVQFRPEDIDCTEGRWFNTESVVSYGNQPRSRKYETVKVELREEETEQKRSPFVPVSDTTVPSASVKPTPPVKPLQLRPEDIDSTEARWFNTESVVSYGSQPRSRKYKTVKVELRDEETEATQPQDTTVAPAIAKRSSIDIATSLPLKTRKEIDDETADPIAGAQSGETVEADGPVDKAAVATNVASAAWDIAGKATNAISSTPEYEENQVTQPVPTVVANKEEESPEAAAARLASLAASTVSTEDRWFNTEKRDFFRPAQKHIPYTIRNPEFHQSPNMARAEKEAVGVSPSAGAFVSVSYNQAPTIPVASNSEAATTAAIETPPSGTVGFELKVSAEMIPLTATTDGKWFNSESKGTHYSGDQNVRQHIPYTIRNPEYHRSPNMMRAEQEAAAASPSAGAFVSVSWTPPPVPMAPTATETKAQTTTPAEAVQADISPVPNPGTITTTDQKWFNSESKGTYVSGVNDVRQHVPYRLIPKGSDEASRRTSS